MTHKKSVKHREKRTTVTFEPDTDIIPLIKEIDANGRRIRSLLINRTLRRGLVDSLQEWARFQGEGPEPAH
jgi:hypothetical protein